MEDVEAVGRAILGRTDVQVALVAALVVLVPAAVAGARWRGWSPYRQLAAAAAGAGLALVPATTLARSDVPSDWSRSCATDLGLSITSPEAALNVLLFAPAAFFGTLAARRGLPVALAAVTCSATVEVVQLVTRLGTCQAADVVRNGGGAAVAAAAAVALLRFVDATEGPPRSELSRRRE